MAAIGQRACKHWRTQAPQSSRMQLYIASLMADQYFDEKKFEQAFVTYTPRYMQEIYAAEYFDEKFEQAFVVASHYG